MRNVFRIAAALSASALLLFAATAQASFGELYREYRLTGIAPCAHSEPELREALTSIPPDVQAYDPGFADAVNLALVARAQFCNGKDPNLGQATLQIPRAGTLSDDGAPGPAPSPLKLLDPPRTSAPSDALVAALIAVLLVAVSGFVLVVRGSAGRRPSR